MPFSCALLGAFAIGFHCYDNIVPNVKCQQVFVLALCLVLFVNINGNPKLLNLHLSQALTSTVVIFRLRFVCNKKYGVEEEVY